MQQDFLFETNVFSLAKIWIEEGKKVAIALVVSTWGASPRKIGSVMIIRNDKMFLGSVSAGCIEGQIIEFSLEVIKKQKSKIIEFGVDDETAWSNGLSCGGKITIFICPIYKSLFKEGFIDELARLEKLREKYEIKFNLKTGYISFPQNKKYSKSFYDPKNNSFFLVSQPTKRLIIIGATHIAQFLAPMAQNCGFDVFIIDPRKIFANEARFKGFKIIVDWPSRVKELEKIDKDTAIVTLTHDAKIDEDALCKIINSSAFYISCLGSNTTHAKRLNRLKLRGLSENSLIKIKAPAGLNIGSKAPSEIAVSIMAELIKYRNSVN